MFDAVLHIVLSCLVLVEFKVCRPGWDCRPNKNSDSLKRIDGERQSSRGLRILLNSEKKHKGWKKTNAKKHKVGGMGREGGGGGLGSGTFDLGIEDRKIK